MRRTVAKLRNLLANKHAEEDLAREVASHLAFLADDFERRGMSPSDAYQAARRTLGGVEQTKQAHRDERSPLWIEQAMQDLRYGLRTLARRPGFTITAVLTLALGIGACTAIFSLVNAVLIRSLPYGDAERLVYLFTPDPNLKIPREAICPSYGDFDDLRKQSRSFAEMSNFEQAVFAIPQGGAMQRIAAARVDADFFSTLQARPEIGRPISANEIAHQKVAVISHAFWISMFGGRSDVLEQSIELDGAHYRIVGVMPQSFEYPFRTDLPYGNPHIESTQVWVPLVKSAKELASRGPDDNVSIARLRPGVTVRMAQAEMSGIMARLDKQYPGDSGQPWPSRQWDALIESFTAISIGPVRPLMRLLLAAVVLVLLIACGNTANLLLARVAERARELGVRAALGAGRGRMVRQLLTESLLIGAGGCTVGIALAFGFLRILPKLDPGTIPRLNESTLDARVLVVATCSSLLISLVAGLLPAVSASRLELTEFLKSHAAKGSPSGHSRMQSALIVAQTAMVVVLLTGAGLVLRSYMNVLSVDTGFSQATVTFSLTLDSRYTQAQQRLTFFNHLVEKLSALPGVTDAGATTSLPLSNSESLSFIWVEGFPNQKNQLVESRHSTAQYFPSIGMRLISGRSLTAEDDQNNTHAVVVNQSFAKKFLAGRNPIGGHISSDEGQNWSTIVGVMTDVRHTSLEESPEPQVYFPFGGDDWGSNVIPVSRFVAVRSTLPPASVTNEIRSTLNSIDPNLAATDIRTMADLVSIASARRRFQASLLTTFAGIALLLALAGLYGLMAFSVNRRMREVGIRMALGAERRDVLLLIMKNASVLVGSGLMVGLPCAWMTTRALQTFLYGVSEHDPLTVVMISLLLIACGLVAALIPARRAASINPMQALRSE